MSSSPNYVLFRASPVEPLEAKDHAARLAQTPQLLKNSFFRLVVAGIASTPTRRRLWKPEFPELAGENGLDGAEQAKTETGRNRQPWLRGINP